MTTQAVTIICAAISAIPTAIASFAVLHTSLKSSADTKELKEKIKELESNKRSLEAENRDLKEKILAITEIPLTLKKGVYYDNSGKAYCPACRAESLLMPLPEPNRNNGSITYHCPKCHAYFDVPS